MEVETKNETSHQRINRFDESDEHDDEGRANFDFWIIKSLQPLTMLYRQLFLKNCHFTNSAKKKKMKTINCILFIHS